MILTSLMLQMVSYLLPFYRSSGSRCRLSDHTFCEQRVYILSGSRSCQHQHNIWPRGTTFWRGTVLRLPDPSALTRFNNTCVAVDTMFFLTKLHGATSQTLPKNWNESSACGQSLLDIINGFDDLVILKRDVPKWIILNYEFLRDRGIVVMIERLLLYEKKIVQKAYDHNYHKREQQPAGAWIAKCVFIKYHWNWRSFPALIEGRSFLRLWKVWGHST